MAKLAPAGEQPVAVKVGFRESEKSQKTHLAPSATPALKIFKEAKEAHVQHKEPTTTAATQKPSTKTTIEGSTSHDESFESVETEHTSVATDPKTEKVMIQESVVRQESAPAVVAPALVPRILTEEAEDRTEETEAGGTEVQKPQTKPTKGYRPSTRPSSHGYRSRGSRYYKRQSYGRYGKYSYSSKTSPAAEEHGTRSKPATYHSYRTGSHYFHPSRESTHGYPTYSPSSREEDDEPDAYREHGGREHPENSEGREHDIFFVV